MDISILVLDTDECCRIDAMLMVARASATLIRQWGPTVERRHEAGEGAEQALRGAKGFQSVRSEFASFESVSRASNVYCGLRRCVVECPLTVVNSLS